jgi:elongation factor P--(R)-beta-lysine ligase
MRSCYMVSMAAIPNPWWYPKTHEDRRPFLVARNRIAADLRGFFGERGFTEVEGAILQISPGNEAHLHAFATEMIDGDLNVRRMYLHTSPEFACKKLLAAGERRIFDFARVFRNRERTDTHHPEFTMLEWYRAGEPYESLMEDCRDILARAADMGRRQTFNFRGKRADPFAEPEQLTVAEAFLRHAGVDLLATISPTGEPDREALAAAARAAGHRVVADDTWADIFSGILVERIEPKLGVGRATILYEYPAAEAALSRRAGHDSRLAERFELYVCGLELANAFGELTDSVEQRRRFEAEMAEKEKLYGERYPIDEDFLAALAIMPQASGIALGFDRLVMLATGASRIEQVIWTPVA